MPEFPPWDFGTENEILVTAWADWSGGERGDKRNLRLSFSTPYRLSNRESLFAESRMKQIGGGAEEGGPRKDPPGSSFHCGPAMFLQLHGCPVLDSRRHSVYSQKSPLYLLKEVQLDFCCLQAKLIEKL